MVNLLSRKAWPYVLTKRKKGGKADLNVAFLKEFKNEAGYINRIVGNNEFSSAPIRTFCYENLIRLDTSISKEEHVSDWNKIGIIDRFVRTMRGLKERYYEILGGKKKRI